MKLKQMGQLRSKFPFDVVIKSTLIVPSTQRLLIGGYCSSEIMYSG
jgi:hypothetical protein